VDDLARRWAGIAAAAYAEVDGREDGFESDHEPVETPDERYEREHPDVPVVRNLEDMWMVAKMENLKKARAEKAAWEVERARVRKELEEREAAAAAAAAAAEADGGGVAERDCAEAAPGAEALSDASVAPL